MQWVSASTGKGELLDVFDEKLLTGPRSDALSASGLLK